MSFAQPGQRTGRSIERPVHFSKARLLPSRAEVVQLFEFAFSRQYKHDAQASELGKTPVSPDAQPCACMRSHGGTKARRRILMMPSSVASAPL